MGTNKTLSEPQVPRGCDSASRGRKDFIADRELLRIRCKTVEQMDSFPSVLKESIENGEIEMLAFPATVKRIKTHVFFVCPTPDSMDKIRIRFEQQFDCKLMEARPPPEEDLKAELKKKGWKCDNCGFTNLEWKSQCYGCRNERPAQNVIAAAENPIVRPHVFLHAINQKFRKYTSHDIEA